MSLSVGVDTKFELTPNDGSTCKGCDCLIIGDMWVFNKYLNGKKLEPSKEHIYCQDCYLTILTANDNE